jgi:hypothetical protein
MSRFVEGQDRQQVTLLPECLDDFIAEDNPIAWSMRSWPSWSLASWDSMA